MGSGKDDKKAKSKKKSLSAHYSEEEKYWDSFDDRKSSSLSRDRDRDYLIMSAKSTQNATHPESPLRSTKPPLLPPTAEPTPSRGLGLQDNDPNTSRFQVDHLATLHYPSGRPQLPEESVQRMRELAVTGTLYSQQVYMCVSSSYLAIRQFHTNEVINWFPMSQISKVYAYSGKKEFTNLLIVHTHDNRGSKPFIHVFCCEKVKNSEIRDLLISFLNRRYSSELTHTPQMDTIEEHSSSEEEPPSHRKLSIWEKLSSRPSTKSKALIFEEGPVGKGGGVVAYDKSPPSHKIGLAAAELNQQRNKANMIQRDIDLLNAALDDVELTADLVHNYITQQRIGKKKKKGKSSSRPAEPPRPPSKSELVDAFQKSRYATNLLGKLGHHLRNPNCCEILNLLMETVKGLSDFTGGMKLVSAVNVPLLTERAVRLISRGLNKEMKVYWNNMGTNWMLTHSSWPQTKPIPKYDVIFSSGYTPDNLPLNEPTIWGNLDPLPELERPTDYSDAYDHIQVLPQTADKISKEIESVVFKQAKQVKSRTDSHSDSTHSLSSSKQTPQTAPRPPSLTAALPQENQLVVSQDYKRRSSEQLSVYRGEVVDVLEKRTDSCLVRNTLGEQGYVPISTLTGDKIPSRKHSPTLPRKETQPPPLSRKGSGRGMGDIPNFDPTPPPSNIPPPPPDIPPNWPPSTSKKRPPAVSPRAKPKKGEIHMAFEDAGVIRELSKRKPLRTTSTSSKHHPTNQQPENVQSEIALKFQRTPPVARKPDINPITASSTKEEVLQWLQHHSYLIAAERMRGIKGSDLMSIDKDELRKVCGFGEGTRLYSHLQKQGGGGSGGPHQLETLVSASSAGGEKEGFNKFLKEHRDKVSGKSPPPDEGPSVWEQIQSSKAEAEKLERRRQKEEIWARRRRTRELEEREERQDSPPPVEREKGRRVKKILKKEISRSSTEDKPSKEQRSRRRHKTSRKRRQPTESSASADSDTTSMMSSDYDSYSTSSRSSEDVKGSKSKKKEPAPPVTPPAPPAAPQYPPTQMYPQMLPPGYPQVGYMQYQDMMTQQLLRHQQVAHAEQDAWNAEMRLKQLRTQQAMGLPPVPTGMYSSYAPPILPATPPYGYPTYERNYTSII